MITTAFAPHAPYSVGDATLARIRQLADELDVPIHTHLHETAAEVGKLGRAHRGAARSSASQALGLVTPAFIGVHATQLEPAEIDALATAGASVVHCPRSNLKLASGACPVAELLRAGVNVALGTDGAASNNRLDLWAELQTAALLAKHAAGDPTAVPAAAAIAMATINGARALNLDDEIGSLVAGKAADVICVDLGGIAHQPVLDPLSQLVYAASRHDVTDVWVAGEHLVANRELCGSTRLRSARPPSAGAGGCSTRRERHRGERRAMDNVDSSELAKFAGASARMVGPERRVYVRCTRSMSLRVGYIDERAPLAGRARPRRRLRRRLAERGAWRAAVRRCSGSTSAGAISRWRASTRPMAGVAVDYAVVDVEALARERPASFEIVTCLEMLEHVPEPQPRRRGVRGAARAGRRGVFLDHQPQPEELRARDRRRGVCARPPAARHARVFEDRFARPSSPHGAVRHASTSRSSRACISTRCCTPTRSAATST